VYISEQTENFALYSIQYLVFITEVLFTAWHELGL